MEYGEPKSYLQQNTIFQCGMLKFFEEKRLCSLSFHSVFRFDKILIAVCPRPTMCSF